MSQETSKTGPSAYLTDLIQHKEWVAENIQIGANDLFHRAAVHDNSKFASPEYEAYEAAFPDLAKYAYGSPEFKAALATIQPALQHHASVNRHHPEYHENGVDDMTLIDLYEMACDWEGAGRRSETNIDEGLEINKERFGIGDQLLRIIKNTIVYLQSPQGDKGE